jgi:hypothetical protein
VWQVFWYTRSGPEGAHHSLLMKLTTLALIVGSVTLGASYATVRAQQSAPASVLAGVFTAEQAKLGEMVYNEHVLGMSRSTDQDFR